MHSGFRNTVNAKMDRRLGPSFFLFPEPLRNRRKPDQRNGQTESREEAMARKRLRDYGLVAGLLPPGKENAITDVEGVAVGILP